MSKPKSITKNYIYNLIYQIFSIITPLVTGPYISRVLGPDGVGKFSFSNSIVSYFTLFAALGFVNYAQREIAKYQDNKKEQTKIFLEIVIVRLISVLVSLGIYFTLIFAGVFNDKYITLLTILSLTIISISSDFSFLFAGNEEFSKMVFVNIVIKVLCITSIFVFVKTADDLWKYTLINAVIPIASNASLSVYLPKMLCKINLKGLNPLRHLKPALLLFLPTIAISVYTYLDKTMIGLITGSDFENGFYEQAEKIVKMVMTVVTSLGTVMIPKNANAFHRNDMEAIKQNIYRSIRFVLLLGIPMVIGLISVSDNMIPWFLGEGYEKSADLMKILSLLILAIGFSNVFGLQYLIPSGQDKKFTISVTCGAIANFLLNLVLIKFLNSYGAAIATVIAESVVTIVMFCFLRKNISLLEILKISTKYLISGAIMGVPCVIVGKMLSPSIINTFLIVVIGVLIYFVSLLVMKDPFLLELLARLTGGLKLRKSK